MKNRSKALKIEAEGFCQVAITETSKNLIELYYMMESIKKRFDLEGIEIPFPYRTIVQKEPKTREEFPQEEG